VRVIHLGLQLRPHTPADAPTLQYSSTNIKPVFCVFRIGIFVYVLLCRTAVMELGLLMYAQRRYRKLSNIGAKKRRLIYDRLRNFVRYTTAVPDSIRTTVHLVISYSCQNHTNSSGYYCLRADVVPLVAGKICPSCPVRYYPVLHCEAGRNSAPQCPLQSVNVQSCPTIFCPAISALPS